MQVKTRLLKLSIHFRVPQPAAGCVPVTQHGGGGAGGRLRQEKGTPRPDWAIQQDIMGRNALGLNTNKEKLCWSKII